MLPLAMYSFCFLFFFIDTAPTEIYTLSLHDALPICCRSRWRSRSPTPAPWTCRSSAAPRPNTRPERPPTPHHRSEEHTSELQLHSDLVCRLLLEKKKHQTRRLR